MQAVKMPLIEPALEVEICYFDGQFLFDSYLLNFSSNDTKSSTSKFDYFFYTPCIVWLQDKKFCNRLQTLYVYIHKYILIM